MDTATIIAILAVIVTIWQFLDGKFGKRKKEIEDTKERLNKHTNLIDNLHEKQTSNSTEIGKLENKIEAIDKGKQEKIIELEKGISDLKSKNENLTEELKRLWKEFKENPISQELKQSIKELNQTLQENNKQIAVLNTEINNLKERNQ